MTLRVGSLASNLALAAALEGKSEIIETIATPQPERLPLVEGFAPGDLIGSRDKPRRRRTARRWWTIQVQYQIPNYVNVSVQARTLAAACQLAIENADWEQGTMCYDASTDVGATAAARGEDADPFSAKHDGSKLRIPDQHREGIDLMEMACAALLDSRQAGGPRRSLRRAIALARMALPNHQTRKAS